MGQGSRARVPVRRSVQLRGQSRSVCRSCGHWTGWSHGLPTAQRLPDKRCHVGLISLSQHLGGGDTLESLQPPQAVKGPLSGEHTLITGGTEGPPPSNQTVLTALKRHFHRRNRSETRGPPSPGPPSWHTLGSRCSARLPLKRDVGRGRGRPACLGHSAHSTAAPERRDSG